MSNVKKSLTSEEEKAILMELMSSNRKCKVTNMSMKIEHLNLNVIDDFYADYSTDIDRYVDNHVNGCPKHDQCTIDVLNKARIENEKDNVLVVVE